MKKKMSMNRRYQKVDFEVCSGELEMRLDESLNDDYLTDEEIQDLESSLDDLKKGRVTVIHPNVSDEDLFKTLSKEEE